MKHLKAFKTEKINESSWDSIEKNQFTINVNGKQANCSVRYIWDTPDYICATVLYNPTKKDLLDLGFSEKIVSEYFNYLESAIGIEIANQSKSLKTDVRDLDQSDIWDRVETQIMKQIKRFEANPKKIISNFFKAESIDETYIERGVPNPFEVYQFVKQIEDKTPLSDIKYWSNRLKDIYIDLSDDQCEDLADKIAALEESNENCKYKYKGELVELGYNKGNVDEYAPLDNVEIILDGEPVLVRFRSLEKIEEGFTMPKPNQNRVKLKKNKYGFGEKTKILGGKNIIKTFEEIQMELLREREERVPNEGKGKLQVKVKDNLAALRKHISELSDAEMLEFVNKNFTTSAIKNIMK